MTSITPTVTNAIDELQSTFDQCSVEAEGDGSGGAFVVVTGIPLGLPTGRLISGLDSKSPSNIHMPTSIRTSQIRISLAQTAMDLRADLALLNSEISQQSRYPDVPID